MCTSRRSALAFFLVNTAAWSQVPTDLPPPPPIDPAMPTPGSAGVLGGVPMPMAPYQGVPLNPPSSAAALRGAALPAVAIREFRSSVGEVSARGATDMFIAALVKSRQFRVLERSRLAEGVAAEKALNQQGLTTGDLGRSQYIGATYLFEATISEASANERTSSFTLGVAGAAAGRGSASDSLAIDVRVSDVESGVIVDAVTVRKEIRSVETRVGGVTSALTNILTKGRSSGVAEVLAPDDKYVSTRKDSVDRTLREAIEEAVTALAARLAKP